MPSLIVRTMFLLALGAGVAAACSPASGAGTLGGGQTSQNNNACASGECGACTNCLEACMCMSHGDPSCWTVCANGGGSGGSAGQLASGGAGGGAGVGTAGTAGAGGSTGGASGVGGSAGTGQGVCGDGWCNPNAENCQSCAVDCTCGTAGSGGVGGTGSAGTGGTGTSGSGGTGTAGTGGSSAGSGGSTGTGLHPDAMSRAQSGVGFSYWWGHGRFLPEGPSPSTAGSCSGSCGSCTHSGSYGGDCSGYVGKIWQVPSSNNDLTVDDHPYSTADFYVDGSQWSTVDQGSMQEADAMVYRSGSSGHIFLYGYGDGWGSMYAYECKGCSYGCTAGMRTASSSYHAIRRSGY